MNYMVLLKLVWKAVSPEVREEVLQYIDEKLRPKAKETVNPVDDVLVEILEHIVRSL